MTIVAISYDEWFAYANGTITKQTGKTFSDFDLAENSFPWLKNERSAEFAQ